MKHEPRLPRDDVNVTARHPLKEGAVLFFGAVAIVAALVALSALLVDRLVPYVPASWETGVFPDFGLLESPPSNEAEKERQRELDSLLGRLVAHWPDRPETPLRVGVLDESTPNALALPGGVILVTRGLLEQVESENELAFVLGHEIGHFRNRDHLKSLGRGLATSLIVAALGQSGSAGDLLGLSGQLSGRSFSRQQEEEADAFGLELVAEEFGHVGGATDFFARLPRTEGRASRTVETYFSTHPMSDARVSALKELARERGYRELPPNRRNFDTKGK